MCCILRLFNCEGNNRYPLSPAPQFSRYSVTGYQWAYSEQLGAPTGDTNNVYPTFTGDAYSTNVTLTINMTRTAGGNTVTMSACTCTTCLL